METPKQPAHFLTLKEIAGVLNVPSYTIYYWVGRNEIPFVRVGRHLRFILDDVVEFFIVKTKESRPNCLQYGTAVKNEHNHCSLKIGVSARTKNFAPYQRE